VVGEGVRVNGRMRTRSRGAGGGGAERGEWAGLRKSTFGLFSSFLLFLLWGGAWGLEGPRGASMARKLEMNECFMKICRFRALIW
jgi:hypothetical protein